LIAIGLDLVDGVLPGSAAIEEKSQCIHDDAVRPARQLGGGGMDDPPVSGPANQHPDVAERPAVQGQHGITDGLGAFPENQVTGLRRGRDDRPGTGGRRAACGHPQQHGEGPA